jgi:4-alpha-glucanotransferase
LSESQRTELAQLHRLASLYDLQPHYVSLDGSRVDASPDALITVLRSLGAIGHVADVADGIVMRERGTWRWAIEPVLVAWEGRLTRIELRLPGSGRDSYAVCSLETEDGETARWTESLADAPVRGSAIVDGEECVAVGLGAREGLPFGYHRLRVECSGRELSSLVISAPRRVYEAPPGREWGLFLPLHALHSPRSWGIGDLTDLRSLVDWAASQGAGFLGTLPLLTMFLDKPFDPSPYAPVSRLLWNEIFIDPEQPISASLPLEIASPDIRGFAEKGHQLNGFEEVPYRAVRGLKRHVLEEQARAAAADPTTLGEVQRFVEGRPLVAEYAAFRGALERLGDNWEAWPEEQRFGLLRPDDYDTVVTDYFAFAQWRVEGQMQALAQRAQERGVRLYLDLPIGVHRRGFDAWRFRDLFVPGVNVGAPPDRLAPGGQDWGFQPMNPWRLRETGYAYMIEYLRHHLALAGMLRIDHAIGLHRMYWIPEDFHGRDGVFCRQPAEELYAVLSLESHRHQAVIVGENLGLVPREVDEGLREHGLPGMYVQMFRFTGKPEAPQETVPPNAVASFSTHDLPSFTAYWTDEDLRERQRLGLIDGEAVEEHASRRRTDKEALMKHLQERGMIGAEPDVADFYRATTALLAESEANWLLMNLEDTWGETHAQNIPGTSSEEHPNWSFRAAHSIEEFDGNRDLIETLDIVRQIRAHRHAEQAGAIEEGANP